MHRHTVVRYLLRVIGRLLPVTSISNASALLSGAGARLMNLMVDPGAAFRGIATDPSWVLAFLAAAAIRFASLFIFYQPAVTPTKLIASLLFQILTIASTVLLASLVTWFAAGAWRVGVSWATAFSILMHVYVAFTLVTLAFAGVAGALLPEAVDVDLRNPPFTNLTSLLSGTDSEVFRLLVGEFDVRSAYVLMLLWLGLRSASPEAPRSAVTKALLTIASIRVAGVVSVSLLG
jgi:hypothetical protein